MNKPDEKKIMLGFNNINLIIHLFHEHFNYPAMFSQVFLKIIILTRDVVDIQEKLKVVCN